METNRTIEKIKEEEIYELDYKEQYKFSEVKYDVVSRMCNNLSRFTDTKQYDMDTMYRNRAVYESAHQMPLATATKIAGADMLKSTMPPAEKSWKEQKEDKKRLEAMQKINPNATMYTVEAYTSIKNRYTDKDNSFYGFDCVQRAHEAHVDNAILRSFCTGYKTNKKGAPLTSQDAEKKEMDRKFIDDYLSGDIQRRKGHLVRMVDDILKVELTADKLDDDYIMAHASELKELNDKYVYFENVMKDAINKPFFDNMEPWKREMLEKRLSQNYGKKFFETFQAKLILNAGVNPNSNTIMRDEATGKLDPKMKGIVTADYQETAKMVLAKAYSEGQKLIGNEFRAYKLNELLLLLKNVPVEGATEVLAKEAGKLNSYVTEQALAVYLRNQMVQLDVENSKKMIGDDIKQDHRRIIMAMLIGYKEDANGEPLNEEEALRKEKDRQLIEDLSSNDPQVYGKRIVELLDEILDFKYDERICDEEYLVENMGRFIRQGSMLMMCKNLLDERDFRPVTKALTKQEKAIVREATTNIGLLINNFILEYHRRYGLSSNQYDILDDQTTKDNIFGPEYLEGTKKFYLEKLQNREKDVIKAREVLKKLDAVVKSKPAMESIKAMKQD